MDMEKHAVDPSSSGSDITSDSSSSKRNSGERPSISSNAPGRNELNRKPTASSNDNGAPIGRSRSNLEHYWSLTDGLSGVQDQDEIVPGDEEGEIGIANEDEFTVTWHENDPMNPRSLSTPRRWLITIIVSTGSLCV